MAKYSGKDMTGTIGATGLPCMSQVDLDMSADVYAVVCGGQTFKEKVVGPQDFNGTIAYTADSSNTLLTGLPPGTSGTFTLSTNGTAAGYPQFSSPIVITRHSQTLPVEGVVGGSITIEGNGALAITIA